jgi:hypothetical protein
MADQVEEYQDTHNLTDAEAIRRLVAAGLDSQEQPTREEIAADLEQIQSSIRGVRRKLDDTDEPEIHRAAQVGTVISVLVMAVVALIGVLVIAGVL